MKLRILAAYVWVDEAPPPSEQRKDRYQGVNGCGNGAPIDKNTRATAYMMIKSNQRLCSENGDPRPNHTKGGISEL